MTIFLVWMTCTLFSAVTFAERYNIARHYRGDVFSLFNSSCHSDFCRDRGASPIPWANCQCQCLPDTPVLRQDVGNCIATISECGDHMAVFVSPAFSEKIPYVVVPKRGGILYPTAEISLTDPTMTAVGPNLCVLTILKVLGEDGWDVVEELGEKSPSFRAVGESGKLFLQFTGEQTVQERLAGKLVMVDVSCQREATNPTVPSKYCIVFRVANVAGTFIAREPEHSRANDYIIIGLCAGLLGVTYVGAVLIYLLVRWQRRNRAAKKHAEENGSVSPYEFIMDAEDIPPTRNEATNIAVMNSQIQETKDDTDGAPPHLERVPVAGVQIDESTLRSNDGRNEVIQLRRRLLFDPSFFDVLNTPPPAAMEFLSRIQEMIAVAKNRIRSGRFFPSLGIIPEEIRAMATEELKGVDNDGFLMSGDDKFSYLAKIPEDKMLTDNYDGLYDFESFRQEMVKKMKRPDEGKQATLDIDDEEAGKCGRLSRSQILQNVFAEEEEAESNPVYDTPPNPYRNKEEKNSLSTYLFGDNPKNGDANYINKPTKTIGYISPPKLEKVRRKVFGASDISEETGNAIVVPSNEDTGRQSGSKSARDDSGYQSSDSDQSHNGNGSLKTNPHQHIVMPTNESSSSLLLPSSPKRQVTVKEWLSVGDNEELVMNFGNRDNNSLKNDSEFSAVTFVSTLETSIDLDEEGLSSDSEYADSLEGMPVMR